MEKITKRNGSIDFFRFICCCFIVLTHAKEMFPDELMELITVRPLRGALGVEFFFVVSGYLMACSVNKFLQSHNENILIGKETNEFLKRKISSLMPTFLVAFVISFIVTEISSRHFSVLTIIKDFMQYIWHLLLVEEAGFGPTSEFWYLSAMILVMWVLYPLCLKDFDKFSRIVAPLVAILVTGYLMRSQWALTNPSKYLGLCYKGLLRAFAEISLGVAIYPIIEKFKTINVSKAKSIGLTAIQLLSWALIAYIMIFFIDGTYDAFALLLITISIIISFSHKSALADFMDNKVCYFLGKISLTLYLSHKWIALAICRYYTRFLKTNAYGFGLDYNADKIRLIKIYIPLVIISTAIIYLISAGIKKLSDKKKLAK